MILRIQLLLVTLLGSLVAEPVNYILGTQTFGPKYQFTDQTRLVETAQRIQEMGSNLLKFSMSRRCFGDQYHLPRNEKIGNLAEMARDEPSAKAVLEMPFSWYQIWAYPFAHEHAAFLDGLSEEERKQAYREIYDLTVHLLKTYKGTGKTFMLGHWEGDWYLAYTREERPTPVKIKGMIDWLNVRQKAIDDAKRDTPSSKVNVYHYTEVNLVQRGMKGESCLVNDVLPYTKVDFVSYSCYDTIYPKMGETRKALHKALDYVESKLPKKEGIEGKRVFIGEYGFPLEMAGTPEKQDEFSREVCVAALEWGCPFVLYWEMYCNEKPNGKHRGFWLIDDQNQKQPFYLTLRNYYRELGRYSVEVQKEKQRQPTSDEIRKKGLELLKAGEKDPS